MSYLCRVHQNHNNKKISKIKIFEVRRRHTQMGYNFFSSPQDLLFRHQSKYHKNIPAKNDPNT